MSNIPDRNCLKALDMRNGLSPDTCQVCGLGPCRYQDLKQEVTPAPLPLGGSERRFARHYSDGSFNVDRGGGGEATAIRRLSGCTDDDDTQLVEVEIRVARYLRHKELAVVPADEEIGFATYLRERGFTVIPPNPGTPE